MKEVEIKTVDGKEISGSWNEKTYSSNVADCVRIYLNNNAYNVKNSEIEKYTKPISEKEATIAKIKAKRDEVVNFCLSNMTSNFFSSVSMYINTETAGMSEEQKAQRIKERINMIQTVIDSANETINKLKSK